MDYEKKYNEALNWMRELYPGLHGATKEDAEHYFPELRESEDERMMRVIGLALTDVPEGRFTSLGTTLKGCLAYLKKQKEQKEKNPAEWSEDDEDNLKAIIRIIEDNDSDWKELTDWLKSLRPQPHCKPSEEQIGALNYAYCELFKRKDVEHNILGPLQKLCDELKKQI